MEDKKHLDGEQVIKALECCTGLDGTDYCDNCPYFSEKSHDCTQMLSEALALIKELTDEYETLHGTYTELTRKVEELTGENEKLTAEVERLTEQNNKLRAEVSIKRMFLDVAVGGIKRERIYTVREMHSILYEEFLKVARIQKSGEPNMKSQEVFAILDQTKKEMLEGNDGTH